MIVREIKDNPEILENFDWFNDYDDTRSWAKHSCPELLAKLDLGHEKWLKEWQASSKKGKK